ncbi:MAG TPA: SDR family oxidoreductase [Noviherbaspirillum sp.]|nr:SDR family oxidoreductase [Noviherbaspirillum sp.]
MKAIITGHTRGLGAAITADIISQNIPVLGLARTSNSQLGKQFSGNLTQVEIDLSDLTAVTHWLETDTLSSFLADCKSVLLINNAGIVQPIGAIGTQDVRMIQRAVALNVAAPMMLANAVVAATLQARDRRILHVSSGAGRTAYPGWSVYCATKAALDQHARAAALDKTSTLRICSLAPGIIDTDMQAEIRATPLEQFPVRERFDALKRNGELSSPMACAKHLVDYLLSERFGQEPVADLRTVSN